MTQEEKQLLLKDLCARLPYGVKGEIYLIDNELEKSIGKVHPNPTELHPFNLNFPNEEGPFIIKPYLRPMSSMTGDEWCEYCDASLKDETSWMLTRKEHKFTPITHREEFLNSHHFDYRGLIEKGLALEAPDGMYKTE